MTALPTQRRCDRTGSRARLAIAAAAALGLATVAGQRSTDAQQSVPPRPAASAAAIRAIPVRGNIYMLAGAGANVAVSVGKDGLVVVDSGSPDKSDALLAALQGLSRSVTSRAMPEPSCVGVVSGCPWWNSSQFLPITAAPPAPRPIIGIINTSSDADRIGGNARLSTAGKSFGVRNAANVTNAWIVAHENVASAMSKLTPAPAADAMPSESYFGADKKLNYINGEPVIVSYRPAAHSNGDSMVHFRASDVLVTGEIMDMASYPVIDVAHGGTIDGMVDALNWILDVAVVEHMMEGGTMIVPGHGRLADAADVAYYRDMMTIFRDRIRELSKRGMTLAQIQAAKPTKDYDPRFGRNPAWTPAQLVEAMYKTIKKS